MIYPMKRVVPIHNLRASLSLLSLVFVLIATKEANAQAGHNEQITVVAPFQPSIPDVHKISTNPVINDTITTKPQPAYEIPAHLMQVTPDIEKLPAVKLVAEPIAKLYRNYLKTGAGNYFSFLGELYCSSLRSKTNLVTFSAKHLSGAGKIKGYGSPQNSSNEAALGYRYFFGEHTFLSSLSLDRKVIHQYGFNPATTDAYDDQDSRRRFTDLGLDLGLQSRYSSTEKINHRFALGYHYLAGLLKQTEGHFAASADADKKFDLFHIGPKQELGIKMEFSHLRRADSLSTLNSSMFTFAPTLRLSYNEYSASAGFRVDVESDSITTGHLYPQLEAGMELIPAALKVYAGLNGQMQEASLSNCLQNNPFVSAVLPYTNTNEKIRVYAGLRSNISRSFNFNAELSNSSYENFAFFRTDTLFAVANSFTLVYDDVSMTTFHALLEYVKLSKLHLSLGGAYHKYTVQTQQYAWYKPIVEVELNGRYDIQNKIVVKVKAKYRGKVWALKPNVNTTGTLPDDEKFVAEELAPWTDINLGLEYRFNKALSFWLDGNNLANNKYHNWYNYPVYGAGVMGGITYSF